MALLENKIQPTHTHLPFVWARETSVKLRRLAGRNVNTERIKPAKQKIKK
jgi:hypothetical protein